MSIGGDLKGDLAQEMESLREEIAQLQSMFLDPLAGVPAMERSPSVWSGKALLAADILDDCPLGMALMDRELRIVKANRMFGRMLGYGPEEVCALRLHNLALEPDLFAPLVQQILDGVYPAAKAEGEWLHKDGESFCIQFLASEMSGEHRSRRCLIVLEDIRERKAAERHLLSEKKLLEWIVNSSLDGVAAFDRDGFFTLWNPAMERIFGIGARQVLGRPVSLACPFFKTLGEDVNFDAALRGKAVLSKNKRYVPEGGGGPICFDGYYGPVHDSRAPRDARDGGGVEDDKPVVGGLVIVRDASGRSGEQSQDIDAGRYLELFENASDMMFTCDLDGRLTSVNKAGEQLLGYPREEAVGMKFSQLVAPQHLQVARRMTEQRAPDATSTVRELELRPKAGGKVVAEVSSRLIFHEGRPRGLQGIVRDIGERKEVESTLAAANRKLEESVRELEQRSRELTLLGELGDILCACLVPEEIYNVVARISSELFPSLGGALFVLDPSRNIVESAAEWGCVSCVDSVFPPDDCWALRRGKVHWVEDTRVGLLCKHIKAQEPRGFMCVPMMAQSNAVGVLHLSCPIGDKTLVSRQRLVLSMAERIATALSNLRMHEAMRTQSIRDPLTGFFNRNFMEEAAELELRRASRTQNPLSFIMLSLDAPRQGDALRQGHKDSRLDDADSAVRMIGMLLQANIRKGDIACRFSDDTFVVVLPQAPREVVLQRAEAFCKLMRMPGAGDKATPDAGISISAGAAIYPEHGQTVDTLLRAAEAAVGRAGQNGGNRVIAAG
ncbi:MAG: PAS domain S-box protein [Acidobacteriota bacterium]|nr:PAS domain S-box protein [Acidobacteriota bacterium]